MHNLYYSEIGILGLIISGIIGYNQLFLQKNDKDSYLYSYKLYLIATLIFFFTNILKDLSLSCDNQGILYLGTSIYFISIALTVVLWIRFVIRYLNTNSKFEKNIKISVLAFFICEIILLEINSVYPVFFSYDKQNIYHPGYVRYITFTVMLAMFVLIAILTLFRMKKAEINIKRRYLTIALFSLTMSLAVFFQIYYPVIPLYSIGLLLGTCMIHTFVVEDEKDEYSEKLEKSAAELENKLKEITSLNDSLNSRTNITNAMSSIYYSVYSIEVKNRTYTRISNGNKLDSYIEYKGDAQEALNYTFENLVSPQNKDEVSRFLDFSTIDERMKDRNYITCSYEGLVNGWSQAYLISGGRDENGKLEKLILCIRSIAEEKLREDEANAVIEGLSQEYHTIWLIDKNTQEMKLIRSTGIATIQSAITMALGTVYFDDVVQLYIEKYVEPEDRERARRGVKNSVIIKELEKDHIYTFNYLRRDDNGKIGYHQIAFVNAGSVEGSEQYVCGFRDIDAIVKEEQSLKQELQEAKKTAEDANEAKTSFLLNMSHDIRTPMNAIIGFRNLLEKYQDDPVRRADYLKKIEESSITLLSLINNTLEMARIEKGSVEISEDAFSVASVSDGVYTAFHDMMQQKKIDFTCVVKNETPYVFGDVTKINEIYYNLISNAYKYTKAGGKVAISLEEIPCDKEGLTYFRGIVSDTGIGMDESFIPHIFDEFSRESSSIGNKIEGTGLGMPIVKRLVDLLGGTIEVTSKKNEGTTFTVVLPHRIADKSDFMEHAGIKVDPEAFKGKRLLLTEDNDLNAEIAIEILSEQGFIVDRAENGKVCVDKIINAETGYYSVILMDIQMPEMNGYEATEAIRNLKNHEKSRIPILAMTANAFEEDKKKAYLSGMNGHIAKPINVSELLKEIAVAIN